jgi:uncharacterized membrane protein HdeD (DUF308 family)
MKNSIKTTTAIIVIIVGAVLLFFQNISKETLSIAVGSVLILLGIKNLFFSLLESIDNE